MSTTNWHLPSTSTRIKSCAAAGADFQHPLKGVQSGDRNEALSAGSTGLQIVMTISRSDFMSLILVSPHT